jgi:hypothetical protein
VRNQAREHINEVQHQVTVFIQRTRLRDGTLPECFRIHGRGHNLNKTRQDGAAISVRREGANL